MGEPIAAVLATMAMTSVSVPLPVRLKIAKIITDVDTVHSRVLALEL